MTTAKRVSMMFGASTLAALGLGYGLARVHAEGVPQSQPLWYSGTVADADGVPLETKDYDISLNLYAREEQHAGETPVCPVVAETTRVVDGRFRIDVSECADELQANPDLFAELAIDGGKPFSRAKIGAVPFALEAQHAVSASRAAGDLAGALVPSGMIAMFAGACPSGWIAYEPLLGRFPRGAAPDARLGQGGSDDAVLVQHSHSVGSIAVQPGGAHTHPIPCRYSTTTHATHAHAGISGAVAEAPNPFDGVCSAMSVESSGQHTHPLSGAMGSSGVTGTGANVPRYQDVIFCIRR